VIVVADQLTPHRTHSHTDDTLGWAAAAKELTLRVSALTVDSDQTKVCADAVVTKSNARI
jgi:hypothetical protein